MSVKVFIDGHVGTTGLRIREWLAARPDLDLLTLTEADRKSPEARRGHLAAADVAVLCLPNDAAREAALWAGESDTRLIDASTAHRVDDDWVYGLPELNPEQRDLIRSADRVSNPGCYATAWLLLVRPLADAGLLDPDAALAIHALSGYSGGGRAMIEKWEADGSTLDGLPFEAPYSLDRIHKHVPEMTRWSGLSQAPTFVPAVGPFRTGMRVQVPLPVPTLRGGVTGKTLWEALDARYRSEHFVRVMPIEEPLDSGEFHFDPRRCDGTNRIDLHVLPNPGGHALLVAILDNLGKGAAGAAIQSLNLMLGLSEDEGLTV